MDFFDRQDQARRNTKRLVVYFALAVICLVLAVYLAFTLIFVGYRLKTEAGFPLERALWQPHLFFYVAMGTLAVIFIGSASKMLELRQGGSAVAAMLGGRPVDPNTTDPDERKLLNVVEEMALASGVPVPQVFVLEAEKGINAFAAGHSPSDAAIGVTHGCMRLLTRDELQGVIGHEFSHILNGDMRLNLRLMGLIFGILCLAVVGRILLHTRTRSRDRNPLPLLGLFLMLIGGIGVFFGRLIQAAVSRQREFLADAAAVQFTRNPDGLAGALKKIGGLVHGSRVQSAHAAEAGHLFFGNGLAESWVNLFATHPPLEQRIRAIDPGFDGRFPVVRVEGELPGERPPHRPGPPRRADLVRAVAAAGAAPPPIRPERILPTIGQPATKHLLFARTLRGSLPEKLRTAARDPMSATALIYTMLLSPDEATRTGQVQALATRAPQGVHSEILRLRADVLELPAQAKLPLVDLTLPALRRMSPAQFQNFTGTLEFVIESDREIDLFEYVLEKIVLRHLEPHFKPARKPVVQYYALKPLAGDCAVLLSAMAHLGATSPAEADRAFRQGAAPLSYAAQVDLALRPHQQCDLGEIDVALNRLAQAVPQIKKSVLNACAQTVACDGVIQPAEAELLRAVADTLDCPMPPFVEETAR